MATQSLSPNRIAQKLREHRHAVIVLAHQSARKAIKAQLRAEGLKLSQFSAKDISIRAEAWFDVHRQELIAEAEHAIATWPGFERWRLPPGHEMFVKSQQIEHSPEANCAITGQIVRQQHQTEHCRDASQIQPTGNGSI
jgi:hypothetical protein